MSQTFEDLLNTASFEDEPPVVEGAEPGQCVPYWPETTSFDGLIPALNNMSNALGSEAVALNKLGSWLTTPASSMIDDIKRATGVQQVEMLMQSCKADISTVSNLFTMPISGEGFGAANDVLNRADALINSIESLSDKADMFMNAIENIGDKLENFESIGDMIDQFSENFSATLEKVLDFDISSTLDKLPDLITDKLMNLDIIKDPLIMLQNIKATLSGIATSITSLKAPTNLASLKRIISTLREIMAAIQDIKAQAERIQKTFQNFASQLKNPNYMALAMSIAQAASGGATFVENPPMYDAKYPYNYGYQTIGGFKFEVDNTKEKERATFLHPAGTSVAINPDGTMMVKGKKDVQLNVTENGDVLVKKALTVTCQGTSKIIASNSSIETSGSCKIVSGGNCMVSSTAGDVTVHALNANVQADVSATIVSNASTEISSNGTVTISANGGIKMITPSFLDIDAGTMNVKVGTVANIAAGASVAMETPTFMGKIPFIDIKGGLFEYKGSFFSVKAGLIELN